MLSVQDEAVQRAAAPVRPCPRWNGRPLRVPVDQAFSEGSRVRDFYSGEVARVTQGTVTLQPAPGSNGLLLLESAETAGPAAFDWHNATVYFVLVDRFANGDPSNDNSYGRQQDGMQEIGTFHGGDLRGLTGKLDYLQRLGVNVLWISSPLEQIHGWVGGGSRGDFRTMPIMATTRWTGRGWMPIWAASRICGRWWRGAPARYPGAVRCGDESYRLRDAGGYAAVPVRRAVPAGETLRQTLGTHWSDWRPGRGQTWHSFNDYIDFGNRTAWARWWGKGWIRTDIGDYDAPGFDDFTLSLSFCRM